MINAIAIDDEPLALSILQQHAAQVAFLNLQLVFTDGVEASGYLAQHTVDMVFLDIKMPDIDGLELAALLGKSVQVVFTTAYPDHAVRGFELQATDYLLKPISLVRFLQSCRRVQDKLQQRKAEDEVFLKENGEWVKIKPAEVLYAEAKGNYMKIVTARDEYLLRMTFAEIQEKLKYTYLRVHKSFAVNPAYINRIELHQLTIGIIKIPVGAGYRNSLLQALGLHTAD